MNPGAFERHLHEAVELNRSRASLYADASESASLAISRSLIRWEQVLIPFARWLDRRAERYHLAGVALMDDLFVPMSGALPFLARGDPAIPTLPPPNPRSLTRPLRHAARKGGLPAAIPLIDSELARLEADPGCWCMSRHLLESVRRVSFFSSPHAEHAREAGLPSPLWIHWLLFRLHLLGLPAAARLDIRALALQRMGIPILCRDLPPVPLP